MASERIAKAHAQGFIAAWLGWAFDGLDGYLYSLVALPFVAELMRSGIDDAVKQRAAWIQAVFMFGWAIGGALFGRIGDKIGRSRTLTLTILTYALFTGLSAVALNWWMLLVFRFVSALGIGGEWAAGSALVSETFHPKHRGWASAALQSGYMVGMILAAVTVGAFGSFDSNRWVFLVGVIPALATVWIRKAVPEPETWKEAREERPMPRIAELFSPGVAKNTILTLAMTSICLTTIWAFLFYNPQILRALPEVKSLKKPEVEALVRNVTIVFCIWNIVGNFGSSYLATFIGFRKAFTVYLVCACAVFIYGFNTNARPMTLDSAKLWFNLAMFFGTGIFALFPMYIPNLFPTLLRTTGAGFCYNFGRLVAGIGTIGGGWITTRAGGPAMVVYYVGFLYILGVIISFLMPELPRGEPAT